MSNALYGEIPYKAPTIPFNYTFPTKFDNYDAFKVPPLSTNKQSTRTKYGQDHVNDDPLGQLIPGSLYGKKYDAPIPSKIEFGESTEVPVTQFSTPEATKEAPVEVAVEKPGDKQKGSGYSNKKYLTVPPSLGYTQNKFFNIMF